MPRKTRMYLPGVPVHVVQRGNNRTACFFADDDYLCYKAALAEGLRRYGAQARSISLGQLSCEWTGPTRYADHLAFRLSEAVVR